MTLQSEDTAPSGYGRKELDPHSLHPAYPTGNDGASARSRSIYSDVSAPEYGQQQPTDPLQPTAIYNDAYGHDSNSHTLHPSSTIIDSEYPEEYYHPPKGLSESMSSQSLVKNASDISGANNSDEGKSSRLQDFEFSEPVEQNKSPFAKLMNKGRYPIEQRIEDKKRGIGRQKYPFVCWGLAVAMTAVFIYELVRNSQEQGSPISTKPVFNPMLGPSQSALINFGARYPPCMKMVTENICGFGGFHQKPPDQWWRFITPIFIHAGIIHICLNMLTQLLVSAQIEKDMGSGGFIILYFSAGIFGNVLGGNFALAGLPSVGASGAIFGTISAAWIDLFAHWRYKFRPGRQLAMLVVELIVGIGLGYIPGVDNFAHLGGFFMGLLVATTFYPVVSVTKRHKTIVWILRIASIPAAVLLMVLLVRNFYTGDPYAACSGCRYLSCFPTSANNHCQGNGITITSSSTGTK